MTNNQRVSLVKYARRSTSVRRAVKQIFLFGKLQ